MLLFGSQILSPYADDQIYVVAPFPEKVKKFGIVLHPFDQWTWMFMLIALSCFAIIFR